MESGADRKIKKKLLLKSFKKGYKKITTSKKYKEKVKKKKQPLIRFEALCAFYSDVLYDPAFVFASQDKKKTLGPVSCLLGIRYIIYNIDLRLLSGYYQEEIPFDCLFSSLSVTYIRLSEE
jgi:hypothetical protein